MDAKLTDKAERLYACIQKKGGGAIEGLNDAKQIISVEKGFDARTLTQADIDTYGLGE